MRSRRAIVACVRALDVADVRAGIADGAFAAGLAARATRENARRDAVVVPAGETRRVPRAVAGDRARRFGRRPAGSGRGVTAAGTDLVDLLARLGLRTLGAFAELPPAAVLGRFGPPARWPTASRVGRWSTNRSPPSHPRSCSRRSSSIHPRRASTRPRSRRRCSPTACWPGSTRSGSAAHGWWWRRRPSTASTSRARGATRARSRRRRW